MSFTDKTHVEAMFRTLTSAEVPVADSLIRYAEAQLVTQVPSLQARWNEAPENGPFRTLVTGTVTAAVVRVLRNPDGWREFAVDDGRGVRDAVLSSGLLSFQPSEISQLMPAMPSAGMYVIGLGG